MTTEEIRAESECCRCASLADRIAVLEERQQAELGTLRARVAELSEQVGVLRRHLGDRR